MDDKARRRWVIGCLLGVLSWPLVIPWIVVAFIVGTPIEKCFGISFDASSFVAAFVSIACTVAYLVTLVMLSPSLRNLSTMSWGEFLLTIAAILIPLPLVSFLGYMTIMDALSNGNPFAYRVGFGL